MLVLVNRGIPSGNFSSWTKQSCFWPWGETQSHGEKQAGVGRSRAAHGGRDEGNRVAHGRRDEGSRAAHGRRDEGSKAVMVGGMRGVDLSWWEG